MAAMNSSDLYPALLEKVDKKLHVYFETSDQISGLIKGVPVEKINKRLFRIPIQLWRGGALYKYNNDGGSYGTGNGMKLDNLSAGFIDTSFVTLVNQSVIDASKSDTVVNAFAKQLADTMTEIKVADDIQFHGDGSGILTGSSSAYAANVYTFAGATDYLGVGQLREGMTVSAWDSTGTTLVLSNAQITAINYTTKQVTLSGTLSNPAQGDILAFAQAAAGLMNVGGAGGSTLGAGLAATWPGTPSSSGVLTGDSFRHGFRYVNNASSTYYLGKLKTTYPQMNPQMQNASSTALSFPLGLLLIDGIVQRRDADILKGMVGVAHMSQRARVHELGIAISQWERGSGAQESPDLMPKNIGYDSTFNFCGVKCYLSKRQDRSRVDFFNPKVWGRAEAAPTEFVTQGGSKLLPVPGTSGDWTAAQQFIVRQSYDFVCFDPGAAGAIYGLTLPSGY